MQLANTSKFSEAAAEPLTEKERRAYPARLSSLTAELFHCRGVVKYQSSLDLFMTHQSCLERRRYRVFLVPMGLVLALALYTQWLLVHVLGPVAALQMLPMLLASYAVLGGVSVFAGGPRYLGVCWALPIAILVWGLWPGIVGFQPFELGSRSMPNDAAGKLYLVALGIARASQLRWACLTLAGCLLSTIAVLTCLRRGQPSSFGWNVGGILLGLTTIATAQWLARKMGASQVALLGFALPTISAFLLASNQACVCSSANDTSQRRIEFDAAIACFASVCLAWLAERAEGEVRALTAAIGSFDSVAEHGKQVALAFAQANAELPLLACALPPLLASMFCVRKYLPVSLTGLRSLLVPLALASLTINYAAVTSNRWWNNGLGVLIAETRTARSEQLEVQFEILGEAVEESQVKPQLVFDHGHVRFGHRELLTEADLMAPDCADRFGRALAQLPVSPRVFAMDGDAPFSVLLCWPALLRSKGDLLMRRDPSPAEGLRMPRVFWAFVARQHRIQQKIRFVSGRDARGRIALARTVSRLERYPQLPGQRNARQFCEPGPCALWTNPINDVSEIDFLVHLARDQATIFSQGLAPVVVSGNERTREIALNTAILGVQRQSLIAGRNSRMGLVAERSVPINALGEVSSEALLLLDPAQGGSGERGKIEILPLQTRGPVSLKNSRVILSWVSRHAQDCYDYFTDRNSRWKGRVELLLRIETSGSITSSSASPSGQTTDELARCISTSFDRPWFGRPSRLAEVRMGIVFTAP